MIDIEKIKILKGAVEEAIYKEQEIQEYACNPFIEALPEIFTEEDVVDRFTVLPEISEKERNKAENLRYHIIKRAKNFIQPLPIHVKLERKISSLIRRGYLSRNPIDKKFLENLRILNGLDDNSIRDNGVRDELDNIRSTADSLSIIGISGIGKTTAIERLLLMYPQVIKHFEYKGNNLTRTQIVWLKIDCPYDGSLSTLCKNFFTAIDDILGTRYLEKFGYSNRITSTMLINMTKLAWRYGIGILIIDEIQHLLNTKNDMEDMLNFFVTLTNTVGIPTVLIGTSKAQKVFSGNFRQARRAASEGSIMWDRMKRDDNEWKFFVESLWDIQGLKKIAELTDELMEAFYDECQGITAVAVNLFILAQERALQENKEEITIDIIRKTAKNDLNLIKPMIKALRDNNLAQIVKYEDISLNLDELAINYREDIELAGVIKEKFKERKKSVELKKKSSIEGLILDLTEMGIFDNLSTADINKICEAIVNKSYVDEEYSVQKLRAVQKALELNETLKENKNRKKRYENNEGLIAIYEEAQKQKKHPYELLKEKGFIKNPLEEFLKVN
ncbi:ATP-binding protein [Clostridium butyricum]|uniref:Putative transposon Tn7 transposition protein TnsC n=1 Tax=Clostridium butyricum E4 str. BoNT E BL5262 TaxID=632245 RepID=C4IEU6_CLOBU|nr:ATP-binding protein [Clostridium butyricum]EDT74336.1 transposon Tn7 transposition protein TnsC [Clostridium butyricum 5521]EEP55737.1 putative transposon Tn7 transposition protein TnsC [Clostridium butyricum E4 str. BoNT E BL5262]NFL29694.1 ATP-binding protein [Clostridium butyricum]NFS16801.1 ATP-binding protein [Clostridium butyricum]